jgi:hypothetical protein
MRRLWGIALVVVVVLSAVGFAQTHAGNAVLRRAGLAAAPLSYVELYFAHPGQLLTQLYSQEALLDPAFEIGNKSGAARRIDWTMLEIQHGTTRQVASGRVTVAAGGTVTIDQELITSCVGGTLAVEIRLAAPNESIRYVPTCWAGAG